MTDTAFQKQQNHHAESAFDHDGLTSPLASPLMKPFEPDLKQLARDPSPKLSISRPLSFNRKDVHQLPSLEEELFQHLTNGRPDKLRGQPHATSSDKDLDDDHEEENREVKQGTSSSNIPAACQHPSGPNLQGLAYDALEFGNTHSPPPREHAGNPEPEVANIPIRNLSISGRPSRGPSLAPLVGTASGCGVTELGAESKTIPFPPDGPLPPISPCSETNGREQLPSIREALQLGMPPMDNDTTSRLGSNLAFPRSPRMLPIPINQSPSQHVSSPDRALPSPRSLSATSPQSHNINRISPHQPMAYSGSVTSESPNTDQSSKLTPSTSAASNDRMSIDDITNPQPGSYECKVKGCRAPPFQTLYLLNSHANVHSSARPHYCPVAGCSRSEGGKGFKRKNEMIRHGLVHESPGYVCPFCPDRDHRYPRPDNLQRHVRVHHVDKSKDDPLLRDVLSQRPDGPNRGRRRRAAP